MNKIVLKAALRSNKLNIDGLIDVIESHHNPDAAAEIILEGRKLIELPLKTVSRVNNNIRTLVKVDVLEQDYKQVRFTELRPLNKWYKTEEERTTAESGGHASYQWEEETAKEKGFNYFSNKLRVETFACSIKEWLENETYYEDADTNSEGE